ncbi:MAG TPA: hypothetical protein V6D20_18290 [Candidatus Obscuribacterales bacterium]
MDLGPYSSDRSIADGRWGEHPTPAGQYLHWAIAQFLGTMESITPFEVTHEESCPIFLRLVSLHPA